MGIFDALSMIGGLCLFLFGMSVMGQALERRAGGKLESLLAKLTTNRFAGLLTGLGVTAVIQSSSATTVMVVGFVNSGLMSLKQAINVIMGANIGTTVTAWILSLSGIEGSTLFLKLLKPMSFTPVLALIGIVLYMFCRHDRKKDTGVILLGFAVLMFGMDIMTDAVSGLSDVPAFRQLFVMFRNPILGVAAGAVLTAVIQSSSASVGILQALAMTGQVTYGAAIPIIMGQNIGTCITAILSSFGTNRNAKRTALVHLAFNVIGTVVWLAVFCIVDAVAAPALFDQPAAQAGIATAHSAFNLLCTALLLPQASLLEKLAYKLVPETRKPEAVAELDERLLATPNAALDRCRSVADTMGRVSIRSLKEGMLCLRDYTPERAQAVREAESLTDHYEDITGSYLVKLSANQLTSRLSAEVSVLLKGIGDLERISDHAVNLVEAAEEMREKGLTFSPAAEAELENLIAAMNEILDLALAAYVNKNEEAAAAVEPLEQIIDDLRVRMRDGHIRRLQQGACSIESGFVWSDILTDLERAADHCANLAEHVSAPEYRADESRDARLFRRAGSPEFLRQYQAYAERYL